MSFENLLLAEPIQRALVEEKYGVPTPIQRDTIPIILDGFDLIGCAQTGSGKTAAFALPVLHHISINPKKMGAKECRTIVLTPTRELATQVAKSFQKYGKYLDIKVGILVGGMPMPPQIKSLMGGLDVVVATPGRLLDLIEQKKIIFTQTDHLILDEVDRMFDMGFIQDVKNIIRRIPSERQTLCFSATVDNSVSHLIQAITKDAVRVAVDNDSKPSDQIDQYVCFIRNQDKSELVCHLIKEESERDPDSKILIFTSTKQGADHLSDRLKIAEMESEALHGDKQQRVRERILEKFRNGKTNVLIATDVAARGLDIKGIDLVLNFDIPKESDTYVHRIGRTGRAGKPGRAYTFCAEFDQHAFNSLERFLGNSIPPKCDHPYHNEIIYERYQALYSFKLNPPASSGLIGGFKGAKRSNRRSRPPRS
jgi:ATP-dependent RNA helicase RhlE